MSTAHNHRRKLIAKLKRKHGGKWRAEFLSRVDAIKRKMDGRLLGTAEEIIMRAVDNAYER